MTFEAKQIVLLGDGDGQKLYLYRSADIVTTIVAADYFLPFTEQLDENDVIVAVGNTGAAQTVDVLVVTAATSTSVTVTNGT